MKWISEIISTCTGRFLFDKTEITVSWVRFQTKQKLSTSKSSIGGNGLRVDVLVVSLGELAVSVFIKQALRLPTPWGPCQNTNISQKSLYKVWS